jgi:hypothetical protein
MVKKFKFLNQLVTDGLMREYFEIVQNFFFGNRFFSTRNPAVRYIYRLIDKTFEAFFLLLATWGLLLLLLYVLKLFWCLYRTTPMGGQFLSLFPERAMTMMEIADMELLHFSFDITFTSFLFCMALGAICRFTHISYFFYSSQGLMGKLIYWGLALSAMVSFYVKKEYGFYSWEVVFIVVMIPTYIMFISCFKYTESLLPEAADVIRSILSVLKPLYRYAIDNIIKK